MPGPAPKDPKIRQRRNRVSTTATLAQGESRRKRMPSLPDRDDGTDWHPLTVAWWRDLWHSPMASEYLRVDRHALYRLAMLIDRFWLSGSLDAAKEIRLEQQAFGLTPIDRRRLQWTIVDDVPERPRRRMEQAESREPEEDPRKMLNWVVIDK